MITDKEFIKEENEEEILSVIESFLNRWIKKATYELMDLNPHLGYEEAHKEVYDHIPTDKERSEVVKDMIKAFKNY